MLSEALQKDIQEVTSMIKQLDSISMMIITSNAVALLARQELAKSRTSQSVRELTTTKGVVAKEVESIGNKRIQTGISAAK